MNIKCHYAATGKRCWRERAADVFVVVLLFVFVAEVIMASVCATTVVVWMVAE